MLSFRSLSPRDLEFLTDRRPPRPEQLAWREAIRLRKDRKRAA